MQIKDCFNPPTYAIIHLESYAAQLISLVRSRLVLNNDGEKGIG